MKTLAQIAAARQYAPPLVTFGQADKRGARVRTVNPRAVDYAKSAGLSLEDIYPGGAAQLYPLAPPAGAPEESVFIAASGLGPNDVYPATFTGEPAKKWRWGWSAVGFAAGAMAGGPIWALAAGVIGGLP